MGEDVKKENQETSAGLTANDQAGKNEGQASKAEDNTLPNSVPYSRFKEKVDEIKSLKKEYESLKAEAQGAIEKTKKEYQTYYESEISKLQRQTNDSNEDLYYYEDPNIKAYNSQIDTLKGHIESLNDMVKSLRTESEDNKLKNEIKRLREIYPSMDEYVALSMKKIQPDLSLDECAEFSHKKIEEMVKTRYDAMMEAKKEAAKKPIFASDGKFNIKPEERPKNLKEAHKRIMEALGE